MEKYKWSLDDDYLCCMTYIRAVFDWEGKDDLDTIVDVISDALPYIPRGSIRMKMQNIKQIALDSGLDDRLEISPLTNYSKQCKRAFDMATKDFEPRMEEIVREAEERERRKQEFEDIRMDEPDFDEMLPIIEDDEDLDPLIFEFNRVFWGKKVCHEKFGVGVLTEIYHKYLSVDFSGVTRKFAWWHTTFKVFLKFEDSKYQALALIYLSALERMRERRRRLEFADGMICDPIEKSILYAFIEFELEALVKEEMDKHRTGYIHPYNSAKKKVLKEKFGIEWEPPKHNPYIVI